MEEVDAAGHMLEFLSMKDGLCGVGAVSRAYKAQTEAAFSTIILRYQINSAISPFDQFARLRHLRFDALGGARCLAGLETVAGRLESLVFEIKTPAVAKAVAAIPSLPKLRHLHLGESPSPLLLAARLNVVGKFPSLECLAVDDMSSDFYEAVLGPQSNSLQAFPTLRSLAFPDDHVLFGKGQQYPRFASWNHWGAEAISRYPETPGVELEGRPDTVTSAPRDSGKKALFCVRVCMTPLPI